MSKHPSRHSPFQGRIATVCRTLASLVVAAALALLALSRSQSAPSAKADVPCEEACDRDFQQCPGGGGSLACKQARHKCRLRCPTATVQAELGLYKQTTKPEVYYLYKLGHFCHVQNESQLQQFGGDFRTIAELSFGAARFTGGCGWPNGLYRTHSNPQVYRLFGRGSSVLHQIGDVMCRVKAHQLPPSATVVWVDDGTDLRAGRRGENVDCTDKEAAPGL